MNNQEKSGSLSIIIGPMFSGKTYRLNEKLKMNSEIMGMSCLKIFHQSDLTRNDANFNNGQGTSHSSVNCDLSSCGIDIISCSHLSEINVDKYQFIGIDEAQFFPDLKQNIQIWVEKLNKNILICGLDGDFEQKPIGEILECIPFADSVEKVCAICRKCIQEQQKITHISFELLKAPFTKRLVSGSEQILVGGKDFYEATCRYHYRN